MSETILLPKKGRSSNYYARFVLKETANELLVTNGEIVAPKRGDEIMTLIQHEFQNIATMRKKPLTHIYEAWSLGGKKLIQRHPSYTWSGRSSDHSPLYKRTYRP